MTPDEFDAIEEYDEDYRYALINGVVVVNAIPSKAEVDPNEDLGYLLRFYQERHPEGRALDKTLPERYVRTQNSRRRADPKQDVPTIAVEFVSYGRRNRHRDYVVKQQEYREAGVREYWIIDRFKRTMTVFASQEGEAIEARLGEADVYRTALLPGFELPLARLFGLSDDWA